MLLIQARRTVQEPMRNLTRPMASAWQIMAGLLSWSRGVLWLLQGVSVKSSWQLVLSHALPELAELVHR